VHGIELVDWQSPVATIYIHSSKGFYVRSLARDLGERLGTVAHLSNLVRLATGPFDLADAWTFAELESLSRDEVSAMWSTIASHPDALLRDLPTVVIAAADRALWNTGMPVAAGSVADGTVNVYAADGTWLGIGHGDAQLNVWRPMKVMANQALASVESDRNVDDDVDDTDVSQD
jgi:tRNA pseudouridine55 synthase